MELRTTDFHTAGEPFRIVTGGVPDIPGATVRERREAAAASEEVDAARRLLCHEPRGHADVEGMAYQTGEHRFVLDPRDPLGTGFVLR
jgi:proline racemase